ncbi:four helix bundle protein [Patescibacteria group bacterium]
MSETTVNYGLRYRRFALDIIRLVSGLRKYHHYEIISQITRSSISIGANFQESRAARTDKEFIGILSISLREARETKYLLEIIRDLNLLSSKEVGRLRRESIEITNILAASILTKKLNIKKNKKIKIKK